VKINGETEWLTDPDGMEFRVIYRSRCEHCDVDTESYDLDDVVLWTKDHRHILMSYRTEFADTLPREVPRGQLEQHEQG
jgi:hypothetical protein